MEYKEEIEKGEKLFANGQIDQAKDIFELILQNQPENHKALNNIGVIHHTTGNLQEAEGYFLKAIEAKEDYPDALVNLANLYQGTKRWEEAAVQLEKHIAINGQDPNLFNQLGMVYLEMGNTEKARIALKKSFDLNPDQESVIESLKSLEKSNCTPRYLPTPGSFRGAFAEINITPNISEKNPVFLQGIGDLPRKATAISTPLMMQMFLLEDDHFTKILFIAADLFGFGPEIVQNVRALVAHSGIEPEGLILNASHTHYAPGTISHASKSIGPFYEGYAKQIVQAIAQQLPILYDKLEECELSWGKAKAQIGVSRRLIKDGKVVFAPNPEGYYDRDTPILLFHMLKTNKKVLLVNHGCHPTGLGSENVISSDYPGYMRNALQSNGVVDGVMFLQGGAGSTKESVSIDGDIRFCEDSLGVKEKGETLANQITEGLKKGLHLVSGPIVYLSKQISLPLKSLPHPDIIEKIKNDTKSDPLTREWAANLLTNFPTRNFPDSLSMEIQIIFLGKDVTFIALPGEPVAELARDLRRLNNNPDATFILGYTNGLIGYLPTDDMIEEGGYEPGSSHFVYLQPSALDVGAGSAITSSVKQQLGEYFGEKKTKKVTNAKEPVVSPQLPPDLFILLGGENEPRRNYIQRLYSFLLSKRTERIMVVGKEVLHPYVMKGIGLSKDGKPENSKKITELIRMLLNRKVIPLLSFPVYNAKEFDVLLKVIVEAATQFKVCMITLDSRHANKCRSANVLELDLAKLSVDEGLNRISSALGADVSQCKSDSKECLSTLWVGAENCKELPEPVFMIGPPRSGTTLLYQLMLNRFHFAFFSNFISEHVGNPVSATLLQKSIYDDVKELGYTSKYGQTQGDLGPSEFGEFWYRWFPRTPNIYVQTKSTPRQSLEQLFSEIMGVSAVEMLPMLIKNTFNSMRIAPLVEAFSQASFIVCRRDPEYIAQSLLKARIDLFGNKNAWWSLPCKEFYQIKDHYGWEKVAEQVHYIYKQIAQDENHYGSDRFCHVDYTALCQDPNKTLGKIADFLRIRGISLKEKEVEISASFKESKSISINETDFRLIEDKLTELGDIKPKSKHKRNTLEDIEDFITSSPQGSIFCRPWWLEAVAPGQWDYLIEFKGNNIAAMMPIVWRTENQRRIIGHPPLTQTLGILFPEFNCKYVKMVSHQTDLIKKLIDLLPDFIFFQQNFNYNFTNWMPFLWKGFNQTTRYTYVIHDLTDLDEIWKGFRENIKTDIRKAEKKVRVTDNPDIDTFLNLNELTFKRQGQKLPYTREFVKRLDNTLKEHDARKMFFAVDDDERMHAATYIVWDEKSAYYLMSGADPELRNSGATSLLIWESIKFASQVSKKFDFEGSIMEPIERFFRAFGGKQMPYFQIIRKSG